MNTAERLMQQTPDFDIHAGRVRGLMKEMQRLPLCADQTQETLVEYLVNFALVHGDPDLFDWHQLLQKSVSAWERTYQASDSQILLNSLSPFTLALSEQRYQQSRLDDLCCQILMHIRPVQRGESWFCSDGEIRSFLAAAFDGDFLSA